MTPEFRLFKVDMWGMENEHSVKIQHQYGEIASSGDRYFQAYGSMHTLVFEVLWGENKKNEHTYTS